MAAVISGLAQFSSVRRFMIQSGHNRTVFVDVDDTLVRSVGVKRIPMPSVVASVRDLHQKGVQLYLWSSGGAEYARSSAVELGIAECFVAFLPKPHAYIDDQAVEDWRFCKHVLPSNAADA
jgi:cation transport ATPase